MIIKLGEESITPNIYLEPYYAEYESGTDLAEIVLRIIDAYDQAMTVNIDASDFDMALDSCEKHIIYRLVAYNRNNKLLKQIPHIRFLDLAITFHYLYSKEEDGIKTFRITNEMMKKWKITVKKLFKIAQENTTRMFPIKIRNMNEVIGELLSQDFSDMFHDEKDTNPMSIQPEEMVKMLTQTKEEDTRFPLLIMSNSIGINGASALIYPDAIKSVADEMECDIYVLPSSIHEVIIAPITKQFDSESLTKMVQEVNETQVPEEDILSDHVYIYKRESNSFQF